MDWGSVPDWISSLSGALAATVAAIAGYVGVRTFQHQRTSYDVSLAMDIFRDINTHWNRVIDGDSKNYYYEIGQILVHFEIAATLFNKRVLTGTALPILRDHIVEVYSALISDVSTAAIVDNCRSSDKTFSELDRFLKKHFPTALTALDHRTARGVG
jgi:hypothetical protein